MMTQCKQIQLVSLVGLRRLSISQYSNVCSSVKGLSWSTDYQKETSSPYTLWKGERNSMLCVMCDSLNFMRILTVMLDFKVVSIIM